MEGRFWRKPRSPSSSTLSDGEGLCHLHGNTSVEIVGEKKHHQWWELESWEHERRRKWNVINRRKQGISFTPTHTCTHTHTLTRTHTRACIQFAHSIPYSCTSNSALNPHTYTTHWHNYTSWGYKHRTIYTTAHVTVGEYAGQCSPQNIV